MDPVYKEQLPRISLWQWEEQTTIALSYLHVFITLIWISNVISMSNDKSWLGKYISCLLTAENLLHLEFLIRQYHYCGYVHFPVLIQDFYFCFNSNHSEKKMIRHIPMQTCITWRLIHFQILWVILLVSS